MSEAICSEPDWDNLTEEEHARYLIRYEFFDEWLGSLARSSGMTLDEYDGMIRGKYADMTDEEYYYGEEPTCTSPEGEEESYHPDDDED
jgi:hypothetical protein